jgi:hypothetical protein
MVEDVFIPPLDVLTLKVKKLQVTDEVPKEYVINITFFNQLLINGIIKAVGSREFAVNKVYARGTLNFDPSDYEKMCLMADSPVTG